MTAGQPTIEYKPENFFNHEKCNIHKEYYPKQLSCLLCSAGITREDQLISLGVEPKISIKKVTGV